MDYKYAPLALLYIYVILSLVMLIVIGYQLNVTNAYEAEVVGQIKLIEMTIAVVWILGIAVLFISAVVQVYLSSKNK